MPFCQMQRWTNIHAWQISFGRPSISPCLTFVAYTETIADLFNNTNSIILPLKLSVYVMSKQEQRKTSTRITIVEKIATAIAYLALIGWPTACFFVGCPKHRLVRKLTLQVLLQSGSLHWHTLLHTKLQSVYTWALRGLQQCSICWQQTISCNAWAILGLIPEPFECFSFGLRILCIVQLGSLQLIWGSIEIIIDITMSDSEAR